MRASSTTLTLKLHDPREQQGLAVIASVGTFLLRIDQLAASTDPLDQKALQHLEQRGLNNSERQKAKQLLAGLLGLAELPTEENTFHTLSIDSANRFAHLAEPPEADESTLSEDAEDTEESTPSSESSASEQAQETLQALMRWHREWSTIARKVITRKDYLISLGLRQRATAPKTPQS